MISVFFFTFFSVSIPLCSTSSHPLLSLYSKCCDFPHDFSLSTHHHQHSNYAFFIVFSFACATAAFHFPFSIFIFGFYLRFLFLCWLFEAANLQMSLNAIFIGRANVLHCVFNALIVVLLCLFFPLLSSLRGRGSIYHCSRRMKAWHSGANATFYERLIWATLAALKSHKCCASFIFPKRKKKWRVNKANSGECTTCR